MKKVIRHSINMETSIIDLPKGSQVLHFGEYYGQLSIWVLSDEAEGKEQRIFQIYGTGDPIRDLILSDTNERVYISSYIPEKSMMDAREWHLFENRKK